jgi:hypothetical protein
MTDYCDLQAVILRIGGTAGRPPVPSSKQWVYVDYETGKTWGVSDTMTWYELAPAFDRIVVDDDDEVATDENGNVVEEAIP